MDIYFLGWIYSFLLMIFVGILMIQRQKLKKNIMALNQSHERYVMKQIIDLRRICHNINTPLNSIMTVFEVFQLNLYGTLPLEYQQYTDGANEAIEDLKQNIHDIQSYCDYYAQTQNIKITDIQNYMDKEFKNPYVLNIQ